MTYIQPVAINCTERGVNSVRGRARAILPEMPGRDLVRDGERRHRATLPLRVASIRSTQNRRCINLHRRREADRRGFASARHQNLQMLFGHWPQIPQSDHDGGSRAVHGPQQQRNCRITGGVTSSGVDSTSVRETWNRRRIRMEAHHGCRELLSSQIGDLRVTS